MTNRNRVVWCERGWLPLYFGFCPSEAAWRRELKLLRVAREPYPEADAHCVSFVKTSDRAHCVVVTINERCDDPAKPSSMVGLITHEAMHVWQAMLREIDEKVPSPELEAYAVQHIVSRLYRAYLDTRGPKKPKPRSRRRPVKVVRQTKGRQRNG